MKGRETRKDNRHPRAPARPICSPRASARHTDAAAHLRAHGSRALRWRPGGIRARVACRRACSACKEGKRAVCNRARCACYARTAREGRGEIAGSRACSLSADARAMAGLRPRRAVRSFWRMAVTLVRRCTSCRAHSGGGCGTQNLPRQKNDAGRLSFYVVAAHCQLSCRCGGRAARGVSREGAGP